MYKTLDEIIIFIQVARCYDCSKSKLYEVVEGVRSSLGFLTREVNVQTSVDDNELKILFLFYRSCFFATWKVSVGGRMPF